MMKKMLKSTKTNVGVTQYVSQPTLYPVQHKAMDSDDLCMQEELCTDI